MSTETSEQLKFRRTAHRKAGNHTKDEVVDDLVDLLKELHKIEHLQDRELIKQIEQKYGWSM